MSEELKPCPFCGAEVRFDSNRDWHKLAGHHTPDCPFDEDYAFMVPASQDGRAWLIHAWNCRTPAEQPAPASTGREPDAWLVGIDVFRTRAQADRNVRNPDLAPIPLYRPVAARELDVEAERRAAQQENAEFTEWWSREQACPEHNLITENAAHVAWQERGRRARSVAQSTAPVGTEQAGDAWGVGSCACQACNPHMVGRMMFICPTCGDKRCPHAASHVLNCQRLAPSPNNSPVGADRRE